MSGVCTYPGCGRPVACRGLCHGHDQQRRAGRDLHPLRVRKAPQPHESKPTYPTAATLRQDGHYVLRDLGPVPVTEPDEARAAALTMAGVAVRLDAAADLPRVLDALGLREAS